MVLAYMVQEAGDTFGSCPEDCPEDGQKLIIETCLSFPESMADVLRIQCAEVLRGVGGEIKGEKMGDIFYNTVRVKLALGLPKLSTISSDVHKVLIFGYFL